ncbi:uncharacterized protein METZ01_LOCUS110225, partial [marine metagenome]
MAVASYENWFLTNISSDSLGFSIFVGHWLYRLICELSMLDCHFDSNYTITWNAAFLCKWLYDILTSASDNPN